MVFAQVYFVGNIAWAVQLALRHLLRNVEIVLSRLTPAERMKMNKITVNGREYSWRKYGVYITYRTTHGNYHTVKVHGRSGAITITCNYVCVGEVTKDKDALVAHAQTTLKGEGK